MNLHPSPAMPIPCVKPGDDRFHLSADAGARGSNAPRLLQATASRRTGFRRREIASDLPPRRGPAPGDRVGSFVEVPVRPRLAGGRFHGTCLDLADPAGTRRTAIFAQYDRGTLYAVTRWP